MSPLLDSNASFASDSEQFAFSITNFISSSEIFVSSVASPVIWKDSCPCIFILVTLGFWIIIFELSSFSIITLSAGISSWEIPICFISPCIFFGLNPPSPGSILVFRREVIYIFWKINY